MSHNPLHDSPASNGYVGAGVLADRIIEPTDFVADTEAFVDIRIPRSKGKASYSFIGPGVSQNEDQTINLMVPHGFNVGAATLPHGVINNPHLHFTAEVFVCTRGSFRFDIGEHGGQSIDVEAGTVFSVPTWVFRAFENTGPDDGWLFAVLGGDDTGGIIWAPHILAEAAETGMYLGADYSLLDETAGDDISRAVQPLSPDALAGRIAKYSDAELSAMAVAPSDLVWSPNALLSSVVPGHQTSIAPVIGHGISQARCHTSPITNPHGFSLEWLEVAPGESTGMHRHANSQATFLVEGQWQVDIASGDSAADGPGETATPAEGSIASIPENTWRNFTNLGSTAARAVVVCGSDAPTRVEWAEEVVLAANNAGWGIDAAGYLAPVELIGGRQ